MADENQTDITTLTVQLLSAFVSKNSVTSDGLADLIKTTRAALTEDLSAPAPTPAPEHVPAVSIRKSLSSPDHVLSLIDGKPYKTLKRHLAVHGLSEKEYRERYKLPGSYPMVAPSYSAARRAVAEKLGLGKKAAASTSGKATAASVAPAPAPAEKADTKAAPVKVPAKKTTAKTSAPKAAKAAPAAAPVAAKKPSAPPKKAKETAAPTASAPPTVISNRTHAAAPVAAKKEERKRLSIATPKVDEVANKTAPAGTVKAKPTAKSAASSKAKAAAKPKSLKAAMGAASAHLKGDVTPSE